MQFRIAVIYGSTRSERIGIRGALYLVNQLKERGLDPVLIDALEYNLPFLDKMYKEYEEGEAPESMEKLHAQLQKADGFIIVSGEYNHGIPPALKNLLDHFQKEYFFKPSALATYSKGPFGGARVSVHLVAVMAELGMPSIPSVLYLSRVDQSFDEQGNALDSAYNRRSARFLDEFEWYLEAFANQRAKGTPY